MKILVKIIKGFFITLGVIFFFILIALAYLFIADPFNLKPLFKAYTSSPVEISNSATNALNGNVTNNEVKEGTKNPLLSDEQAATLRSLGIDPANLPSEITPEMQKCFTEKLGDKRTQEIIKGSTPTPIDFLQARSCLN